MKIELKNLENAFLSAFSRFLEQGMRESNTLVTTDYYPRHWQSYSFEKCLESIKNHDDYVRRVDPMLTALKQGKSRDVKYY